MLKWVTLSTFIIFFFFMATSWGYTSLPIVEIGVGDGTVVRAEVPTSSVDRARGLMDRDTLGDNEGMFFVFDTDDRYAFWMKDMNFPIDIIWLDSEMTVVDVETAQPCIENCPGYTPDSPARHVLEVPAGFAAAHGISAGSTLSTRIP
jgi:uncharacterized membrane protein (UPF0127 family)